VTVMKVDYVNPFVVACRSVLKQVVKVEPELGRVTARPRIFTTQQCNILAGIAGHIEGQVIFGMSLITADRLATQMLGHPVVTFDQMAASAITELGNMIAGNAVTLLADAGFPAQITPPTIIRGTNVRVSTLDIPALSIPMAVGDLGDLEVNVSLRERRK
jgi:chemotaxis protein CheX